VKRVIVVFVVLATALGVTLWFKLRDQAAEAHRPPGSSGVVEGTRVAVSARIGARIAKLHAREGDTVEAGRLLAELECLEPDAALAEAEARVAAAGVQGDPGPRGRTLPQANRLTPSPARRILPPVPTGVAR